MRKLYKITAIAAAIAATIPGHLMAQTDDQGVSQLEEIIVTVQKKEERLQSIPVAVTPVSRALVNAENITTLKGIADVTPALSIRSNNANANTTQTAMRGQVYLDAQVTGTTPVGYYVDGVYNPRVFVANIDLADIDRVEVMRGPQGTLYGKNTTGGAINIMTRKPADDFGGKYIQTFGSDGLATEKLTVDTGRYNGFAADVSVGKTDYDGTIENVTTGDYTDAKDMDMYAISLDYKGDNGLYVRYNADRSVTNATAPGMQLLEVSPYFSQTLTSQGFPGFMADMLDAQAKALASTKNLHEVTSATPEYATMNESVSNGQMLEIEKAINEKQKIKSITGYRHTESEFGQDFTPVVIGIPAFGYTYKETAIPPGGANDPGMSSSFYSQELQLIGENDDASINYVAGLYYSTEEGAERQTINYANYTVQNYDNEAQSDSIGAFGQLNYIPDWEWAGGRLTLTGGGRYSYDDKSLDKHILPTIYNGGTESYGEFSESFTNFSPMGAVSWQADPSTLLYAKVSTGYNAGGLSSGSGSADAELSQPYDEETAVTGEIGLKKQFFDNRARINIDFWKTDFQDMQIQMIPDQFNPAERLTVNAGAVTNQGIEIDSEFLLMDGLTLVAGYSYTDSQFDTVDDVYGNSGPAGANIADEFEMAMTPKDKGYIGVTYKMDKTVVGTPVFYASYQAASESSAYYWVGNDELRGKDVSIDSYGIFNARASLTQIPLSGNVQGEISLWAKNLSDEEYVENKWASAIGVSGVFAPERTVGVDLTVKF